MPFHTSNNVLYGFDTDCRYSPHYRRAIRRLVQFFPGMGCVPWLRTNGDCCRFCQLPYGTRFAVLGQGHEDHFTSWQVDLEDYVEMYEHSISQSAQVENITLFNGGSFLTDKEIPKAFRQHVYSGFAKHPTAIQLMIESRPEFVREPMLDEAQELIGAKDLMIGIGLESIDDTVRNQYLRKFIGRRSFTDAIRVLQSRGVQSLVYVFLKAPELSERQAYEDAASTIAFLSDLGVDEIALSCAFVPPGGHLEELHQQGRFRPPWLWTIVKLLDEARSRNWPLSVGGFDDFPPPVAIAHNCGRCDAQVMKVIDVYRTSGVLEGHLGLVCSCQDDWRVEMGNA